MRIGFDARIAYYNHSGLRRYFTGLIRSLASQSHNHQMSVYRSWKDSEVYTDDSRFCHRSLFSPSHSWVERLLLPLEFLSAPLDVLHSIDFFTPAKFRFRTILTVHDLYFLRDPSVMDAGSYQYYESVLKVIPNAAHIVCDSECTKRDLLEFSDAEPERIAVIHPGIERSSFATPVAKPTALPELGSGFILFVGTIEPRKNLVRALKAYHALRERIGKEKTPAFVVAGRPGFRAEEVFSSIEELKLRESVQYLGEIDERALLYLYQQASILMFPSLYEGFGFPLLEAMATETAILTSRNSSLTEVAGDAALFVDPLSIDDISAALERLVGDPELRAELVRKGGSRVEQFSWSKSGIEMLKVYDNLARSL